MTKICYFAWVREAMGRAEENIEIPDSVETIGALIAWLSERDRVGAHAFADSSRICAAIDETMVAQDAPIAGAQEISLFPPVSGG